MNAPGVSIIMPCYNCARTVQTSVQSVLNQSLNDFELIVVDDGSTDDGNGLVNGFNDRRIRLIRQDNTGVSAARNKGIRAARSDCLAFLDADDTWHPDFLQRTLSTLREQPDAVLAYCGWQNLGLPGARGAPFIPPDYETPEKLQTLFTGCRWPIHAVVCRRQAVLDAGGFDEQLQNAEDFALWLGIAPDSPIVRVPEVLAYYHFDTVPSASGNRLRSALHHLKAQQHFLRQYPERARRLGLRNAHRLMYGELLHKAYESYWAREIETARILFRRTLMAGHVRIGDLKYALPSLLPLALHRRLLKLADSRAEAKAGKGHDPC